MRILLLDRDNPKHTIRRRLRGLGAADLNLATLKIIPREQCPPLTKPDLWGLFPFADYDLVVVDSFDSFSEGSGEQDSARPSKALAPLLDICHRENGPAVLLLGNTVRSAAHSRGSGVIEDRADVVFEARDATDFRPTGSKPSWVEELPEQGAAKWAARSTRRTRREKFRLALVATKFRDGEEPVPRVYEVSMVDEPWTVCDVTADVDAAGETARNQAKDAKAALIAKGVAELRKEIEDRRASGQPEILTNEAEALLMKACVTQQTAREIINSDSFVKVPVPGPGHGKKVVCATEIPKCKTTNDNTGSAQPDFGRPVSMHPTEINPHDTRINRGDFETPISVADPSYKGVREPNGADRSLGEKEEGLWI
jgi:hypothetical protein